ncbi:hypothetical protein [Natronincola ferrireducens]|uniref:Uncharacterized protein n=1 Tax=Natronincola ferrireducens TaxID=393762 RepID=A0A1G9IF60_9FIRM|nr:hypothetical protein [Natronincola ferrireducens]SDL23675.1 hypothetical protein SAMN05660472_02849 [Natronincola ferrireducens]
MIRFPNPGSDITTFIRIFQILHSELKERYFFTLDDMSETLTNKNLVSSEGYMGKEALKRSTRKDRSRDPLYNQSKMYAELYRILGWIQSDVNKKLNFKFTYLGDHMANAQLDPLSLFKECILGINYPNAVIDIKTANYIRPFATILRMIDDLDGYISRDEMIIGPLNINDLSSEEYLSALKKIKTSRPYHKNLLTELDALSKNLKIQVNTLGNYTRFPISVLEFCGWIKKERTKKIYTDKSLVFLKLTDSGKVAAKFIKTSTDIRYNKIPKEIDFNSLVKVSFFQMLERGGFEVNSIKQNLLDDILNLKKVYDTNPQYLFSPYQTYDMDTINEALSEYIPKNDLEYSSKSSNILEDFSEYSPTKTISSSFVTLKPNKNIVFSRAIENDNLVKLITDLHTSYTSVSEVVERLFDSYKNSNKDTFYDLTANLFSILGYNCTATRHGINYERWDAIINDLRYSIPIEIKSPSEEEFLSVKAIRQALENKIILLSRKSYITDFETTTLAVGYKSPNDRSDVNQLIEDIYNAYNIRIGVIDFKSLLTMTVKLIVEKKEIDKEEFRKSRGIINVKDF